MSDKITEALESVDSTETIKKSKMDHFWKGLIIGITLAAIPSAYLTILYIDNFGFIAYQKEMIEECESKLPRNKYCTLVAKEM